MHKPVLTSLLSVALLAACAAPQPVRVDRAENVELTRCRTFQWMPASDDAASFTEQRVRAAVMQALEDKGYSQTTENPDCRITYLLAAHERPKAKPSVGVGVGGGSRGVGGGIGVSIPVGQKDQYVGAFTLDVIDAKEKAQIWSGSIDAAFGGPELTVDEAREATRTILAEFPDRSE